MNKQAHEDDQAEPQGAAALLPKPNDPLVGQVMYDVMIEQLQAQVEALDALHARLTRDLERCRGVCAKLSSASHRKNKRIQRLHSQLWECKDKGGADE